MNTDNPFGSWPPSEGADNPFGQAPAFPDLGSEAAALNPFDTPPAPPADATTIPQPQLLGTPAAQTTPAAQPPSEDTQLQLLGMLPLAETETESGTDTIYTLPPVFEHGSVTEDIADLNQTFDDLRKAKAEDFPELEDEKRVTWEVTYGKVKRTVYGGDAKKKKIGEFKASIEKSKDFKDALAKSKDKKPRCLLKPRVTAQSKGERMPVPSYKGVFICEEDAAASGKVITIVPGRDGHVYETRREQIGTLTTRTARCAELSEIRAGFTPALPLVPQSLLLRVVAFFRALLCGQDSLEAIVNVLWDKERERFCAWVPRQTVSHARANSVLTNDFPPDRYLHYIDIHSHNVMPAHFSAIDDKDEKATRVYAVIGKLDQFMPQISVRISNGGKFLPIDPGLVFEPFGADFPAAWVDQVNTGGDAV